MVVIMWIAWVFDSQPERLMKAVQGGQAFY
jgi:hypothetical protein